LDSFSFELRSTEEDNLGFDITTLTPVKVSVGMDMLYGRDKATAALIKARTKPKGTHMNNARVASGVGLRASLPSWKIRGLGYLSLGRCCQLLLSTLLTK